MIVIGIGGSFLGSLAFNNLFKKKYNDNTFKIIYVGSTLSSSDTNDLIEYLKGNSVLIAIGRHKQKSILVGYVADFNKEAFSLISIGVDLQELPIVKINYKQIRYISVMSDYLTSVLS